MENYQLNPLLTENVSRRLFRGDLGFDKRKPSALNAWLAGESIHTRPIINQELLRSKYYSKKLGKMAGQDIANGNAKKAVQHVLSGQQHKSDFERFNKMRPE